MNGHLFTVTFSESRDQIPARGAAASFMPWAMTCALRRPQSTLLHADSDLAGTLARLALASGNADVSKSGQNICSARPPTEECWADEWDDC